MPSERASRVTFEEPNIAHWFLIGQVDEADIMRIFEAQMEFYRGKAFLLLLIDVSQLKSLSTAARRKMATGPIPGKQAMRVCGCAIIGASFHIQVLGLLVAKAARVFSPTDENVLHYCDTEAQAREWIEKRRRELGAEFK